MAPKVNAIASPVDPVEIAPQRADPALTASTRNRVAFADVLQRARPAAPAAVQFSSHAQRRLQSRAIALGESELERLAQAVDKAESKGSRDSLILIDELALVVNIKNRVVVTAIDKENRQDNIFTNIDSVVMT